MKLFNYHVVWHSGNFPQEVVAGFDERAQADEFVAMREDEAVSLGVSWTHEVIQGTD